MQKSVAKEREFSLGLFTMEKLRTACFPTSVFPIIPVFPATFRKRIDPRVRTYPFSTGQVLPARRHGAGLSEWDASSECFRTNIRERWQSKNVLYPHFFFLFRARKWHSTGPSYILVKMGGSGRRRGCEGVPQSGMISDAGFVIRAEISH